ncbi:MULTISPECIES: CPBP family intramembrane glutamic endopeptidase [Anaerococcus]|jgi:predicted metal-dependent membrane protease|uniref:CPBP family intramembrane glutamic endopeptidase n=1 Tax=Anaerococcus TaxID=165779 RepID=UPI001AE6557F|nr:MULTISPECIES: CPBP family intramembrane glutamic endopeptidase [Anaerococcus]MBP2070106.1 membrane protease YdiL (CAAX protease family) [Anaerococcus nagyae]MDU1828876.1 CPBP family intramembrane glutamic endopeptidase [Anaerococcus sp.]MDU1864998.1 CPBP family intramembrane glutamic endopeptidase [Anaerococcus sp.]MDU3211646.1 CPBP family intramembrane glutamic endopeptidase [Anaerococcus sp.]
MKEVEVDSKKIELVFMSLALIAIAGISYVMSGFLTIISSNENNLTLMSTIWLSLSMIIFFIFLPLSLSKRIYGIDINDFNINYRNYLIYTIVGFVLFKLVFKVDGVNIFRNMIVASSEEFLFRFVIYEILKKGFDKKQAIIIGSLLFSLILHLNVNIFINIVSKFPMSIILYLLYDKFGYENAFALHWINNTLVDFFNF